MRYLLLWFSFLIVFIFSCRKNNDTALLNTEQIQQLIDSASEEDTVYIPAGFCHLTESILIEKNITIIGAGIDNTIIRSPFNSSGTSTFIIKTNNDSRFRIAHITFEGVTGTNHSYALNIGGECTRLRIDHCKFIEGGDHSIMLDGNINGVIDHCSFVDDSQESISIRNSKQQDTIWNEQPLLGTDKAIFIEDCDFSFINKGDHAITSVNGASYVFRYNTVNSAYLRNATQIDTHGNYYNERSGYSSEIYNNTLHSEESYYGIYMRGGKGVIFNNTFTGKYYMPVCFANDGSYLPQTGPPYHDDTYPAIDQINSFYVWDNVCNNIPVTDGIPAFYVQNRGKEREHIQKDRDYYDYAMPDYAPYTYPHPLTKE